MSNTLGALDSLNYKIKIDFTCFFLLPIYSGVERWLLLNAQRRYTVVFGVSHKGGKFSEGSKKCQQLKIKSKLQFPPSPIVNLNYIFP